MCWIKITKETLSKIIEEACKHGMEIQRTINDKYDIPATRIKKYIDKIVNTEISEPSNLTVKDKKPDNFICQKCGNMETDKMCSKYCVSEFVEKQKDKITGWKEPTEEKLMENFAKQINYD